MLTPFDRFTVVQSMAAFWISLGVAALLAYPIMQGLIAFKSRQTISEFVPEEHLRKQGTPTMGGLITAAGFLAAMVSLSGRIPSGRLSQILVVFVGFGLIGFLDDYIAPHFLGSKRGLGWKQKILLQLLVSVGAVGLAGFHRWDAYASLFLILFFSNAYNFADGLDVLAGSVGLFFCLGLIGIALISGYGYESTIVSAALMGGLIPFLFLNAAPAKVFMGDVGSLSIGATLGLLVSFQSFPGTRLGAFDPASEWYLGRPFHEVRVAGVPLVPVVLLGLAILSLLMVAELVPVPLQIASVKLRKKRLFPMTPIHHGFEAKGWPESRVVWHFALTQLLLSAIAISVVFLPATSPVSPPPSFRTASIQ